MPDSYRRAIAQNTQETGLFTESARCNEVFWLKNPVSGHPSVQGYKSEVTDIDEPARHDKD